MSELQSRFEKDDPIIWSGDISVGWSTNLLVLSEKWLVLFKNSKTLEKPLVWIPRNMIQEISFSHQQFDLTGELQVKSSTNEILKFGTLSDMQARQVIPRLSATYLERFFKEEESRGRLVGNLSGKGFLGGQLHVFENRIFSPSRNLELDENTVAEVVLEGEKIVSARPTLTRMAALSFLPGTALIPGLALQKKTVKDERQLIVVIANASGSITMNLDMSQLANAKAIASQINAIAEQKHRANSGASLVAPESSAETSQVTPASTTLTSSVADELIKLKGLLDSGHISDEEFAIMKKQLIERSI